MTNEEAQALLVAHPTKRSSRFFPFDGNDLRWLGIWVAIFFITNARTPGLGKTLLLLAVLLIWRIAMITLENDMRIYYMPIYGLKELWIGFVKKGVLWKASESEKETKKTSRAFMPAEVHAIGDVGLIYNRYKKTDTRVFTARGSPISTLSLQAQFAAHRDIATLITRTAATAGGTITVSMGVRVRPDDPWFFWDTMALIGEPQVQQPEAEAKLARYEPLTQFDMRMLALQKFQNTMVEITDITNDIEMVLIVSVKRTPAIKKAVRVGKITEAEKDRQPIMRIGKIVIPYLKDLVDGEVTVLDGEGAERYLKKALSINLDEYYDRAHQRRAEGGEIVPDKWYAEKIVEVTKSYIRVDDTYSTTIKMNTYPRASVYPHEPRSFYNSSARWFSAGVIGETMKGNLEYNVLTIGRGFLLDAISILGIERSGAKVEIREQEVHDRTRELAQSVYSQDFNPLLTISADSPDELEEKVQEELDRLTAEGKSPVCVTGRSRQLPYMLTGTTFIDFA